MIYYIFNVINIIIIVYIIFQLLDVRISFKKTIIILSFIIIVIMSIDLSTNITGILKYSILILVIIIILRLCKVSYVFPIFVCTVITISITLMINDMFVKSLILLKNTSSSTIYNNPLAFSLVSVGFFITDLIILALIKHYKLRLFEEGQIYEHQIINSNTTTYRKKMFNVYDRIILIIIGQMLLLTLYFTINDITILNPTIEVYSPQQAFIKLIVGLYIIILSIIVIFMIKNISILTKEKYQYKIKEKEFAQIQQQDKINRQYKHDLSNHFKLLKVLAEDQKYEELNNYLKYYDEELNNNLITVETGSVELDILLNSKINLAQAHNIVVKYNCLADIECINRHIINLISIIGNVLDNAIEACEKSEKKIINIEISEDALDYIFIIKNTTNNDGLVTLETLVNEGYSTKGQDRGTGLSVVNRLVKKYSGSINISNENKSFVIRINLPRSELVSM